MFFAVYKVTNWPDVNCYGQSKHNASHATSDSSDVVISCVVVRKKLLQGSHGSDDSNVHIREDEWSKKPSPILSRSKQTVLPVNMCGWLSFLSPLDVLAASRLTEVIRDDASYLFVLLEIWQQFELVIEVMALGTHEVTAASAAPEEPGNDVKL